MSTADSAESFTEETIQLWRQYPELNGRSRQRPSPEKLAFIDEVLRGVYAGDATSCNKSHVRSRYRISGQTLQYIPEDGRPPRAVINDEEAYGLIVESHLKYGHAGREKVFHYLKDKFYHVTREEVGWVLRQCVRCKARCKPAEAQDNFADSNFADNIEDPTNQSINGPTADEADNHLPGAYTKKFNALRAESKLDEAEWMNLCLCVARDVRGPMGLDIMLQNEDKGKAWDDHFSPLCDVYAERYWSSKMKGRWWAGDHPCDRILIKDFLRRLFMNYFQKERIHRARISRKAAKSNKSVAPSSEPGDGNGGGGGSGGSTWMRSHPPIKIPAIQKSHADQDDSPCAEKGISNKRQRETDPTAPLYGSAGHGSMPPVEGREVGEPSKKNPRLERVMTLLSNAERDQESEALPNTGPHVHVRKRKASSATHLPSPVSLEPTPNAVFRLDPVGTVFPPTQLQAPSKENTVNENPPPPTTGDVLFMTFVQRDEHRNEIRLIHGDALFPLPFGGVLEKLRKKHRLTSKQAITAIVLDFKGNKLCIDAEDEDSQLDWETWLRVEGRSAKQVEMEVKVSNLVV